MSNIGKYLERNNVKRRIEALRPVKLFYDSELEFKAAMSIFNEVKNVICHTRIETVMPVHHCSTCGRNADNGGVYEDGRTRCPIQEHYALLRDGFCHLYSPAKMDEEQHVFEYDDHEISGLLDD